MKVKASSVYGGPQAPQSDDPSETEFCFLLIPVDVYSMISDRAKEESCTAAQIVESAIFNYMRQPPKASGLTVDQPKKEPLIISRRRMRP